MSNKHTTIYHGNLTLTNSNMHEHASLTEVIGILYILAKGASLPALTTVGSHLDIWAEGASLPALTTVGSNLDIWAEGASLPLLTQVGGYLDIWAEGASLPLLTQVGGYLDIKEGVKFDYSGIKFKAGEVLAVSEYALHVTKNGKYHAGCRGPWTAEEALSHWSASHHCPSRANLFREAIIAHEAIAKEGISHE